MTIHYKEIQRKSKKKIINCFHCKEPAGSTSIRTPYGLVKKTFRRFVGSNIKYVCEVCVSKGKKGIKDVR